MEAVEAAAAAVTDVVQSYLSGCEGGGLPGRGPF